jgi:hypothetical protein
VPLFVKLINYQKYEIVQHDARELCMAKRLLIIAIHSQLCIKIYTPFRDRAFEGNFPSYAEKNHTKTFSG